MRYQVIEDYSTYSFGGVVTIDDSQIPAPALLEAEDGVRMFATAGAINQLVINQHAWASALQAGASSILIVDSTGYRMISKETFSEYRGQSPSGDWTIILQGHYVAVFDHPPSFTEFSFTNASKLLVEDQLILPGKDGRFAHLHIHTEHSALDGLSTTDEVATIAAADGQTAVGITDHGNCAGHASMQASCDAAGIKPVFGNEIYLVDDRTWRPPELPSKAGLSDAEWEIAQAQYREDQKRGRDYWHLILWAFTQEGLFNLWALTTASNQSESFYYKPRCDWELLERYSAGLGASTACLRGPLSAPLAAGNHELAYQRLGRLQSIFDDRLYTEIHTNGLEQQKQLNVDLVSMSRDQGVPIIAVSDSHYPTAEHAECHKVWMAIQTNSDLEDDPTMFQGDCDYHILSADEVEGSLSYLPEDVVRESMANTVAVTERCNARIEPEDATPVFSQEATRELSIQKDQERLVDMTIGQWPRMMEGSTKPESDYMERYEKEMKLLVAKGFCGYFLLVADYCEAARKMGILIGPGRGSGAASIVAYLAGIVSTDGVEAELMFERFLTMGREGLPDFDIDFPRSKRGVLTDYLQDRWGHDHVVRIGTHIRVKNKGIIKDLGRVLKGDDEVPYTVLEKINQLIDSYEANSAGLGRKWNDIFEEDAEYQAELVHKGMPAAEIYGLTLASYRERYPKLFSLADKLAGRLKTYGKHPAGMVVSISRPILDRLPLSFDDDDVPVSQFPMDVMEDLGHVKLDLLTLRTLDSLQETIDQIQERHGKTIDFYSWRTSEYNDPAVWDLISTGYTLGMFQAETVPMTKLILRHKPRSLAEMSDVVTLVRPGPVRSGLTDEFLARRDGDREVSFVSEALAEILEPTEGVIIYQEQVMGACMILGGYDEGEADKVRKILGKKKVELIDDAGRKFISRCDEVGIISHEESSALWEQLAEFSRYSFNKSHAYSYSMLCFWTAWFKQYYPAEFLAGVLAHVDGDRIPDFVNEARQRDFKVLPPDINESGDSFTIVSDDVVRYGFGSITGIGDAASEALQEGQPYSTFDDFVERKGSKAHSGHVKSLAAVGGFDSIFPNRKALEKRLGFEGSPLDGACVSRDESTLGPGGLPCSYDWTSVPVQLTKSGKPKKTQRGAPKRCTKACWKYEKSEGPDFSALDNYTDREIRQREVEVLGLYLSSSPFDRFPAEVTEQCATSSQIPEMHGEIMTLGIVSRLRSHIDRSGNEMAFLEFSLFDGGDLSVACFASSWRDLKSLVNRGSMGLIVVRRNDRGCTLSKFELIEENA